MSPWSRLGEAIVRRQAEQRIKGGVRGLARATGINERTIGDLVNARKTGYARDTIAALEVGLGWPAGTVAAILAGQAVEGTMADREAEPYVSYVPTDLRGLGDDELDAQIAAIRDAENRMLEERARRAAAANPHAPGA